MKEIYKIESIDELQDAYLIAEKNESRTTIESIFTLFFSSSGEVIEITIVEQKTNNKSDDFSRTTIDVFYSNNGNNIYLNDTIALIWINDNIDFNKLPYLNADRTIVSEILTNIKSRITNCVDNFVII